MRIVKAGLGVYTLDMRIALALTFFLTACSPVEEYVVEVDPAFSAQDVEEIALAGEAWDGIAGGQLRFRYQVSLPSYEYGTIAVMRREELPIWDGHRTNGFTNWHWNLLHTETRAEIRLRPGVPVNVKMHEFGHALRLEHSDNPANIMFSPVQVEHLSDEDVEAFNRR